MGYIRRDIECALMPLDESVAIAETLDTIQTRFAT